MEFQSCFDIIGPIMVGPSSSHTAGVVSIGKFIYELLEDCPQEANIVFYDSFAETYQGHGTDKALLGGLLGMETDDPRIKYSLEWAKKDGMQYRFEFAEDCKYYDHPNITIVTAKCEEHVVKVGGVSLGGGLSKIFMIDEEMVDIRLSAGEDFTALARHYQPKRKRLVGAK
ncbi:hypothetical protein COJ85_07000 [Bacillus sp. AFS076308]|uniref:serine dehydratase beta chain n=1 Tax=unclassified Bacillus (in: firmicutes) TaxID=185979 RepID=UPI000BF32FBD|nr:MULTISPECIES: serine dehydratase beta chain [unclassified Bacillus (in: firmicutes)]PFO06647.1 hypothetical protein COJ85_07000 [Bacillus sp. AFS076308]PGV52800.1 hypothetical protein COD92_08925 [Bacillus sp. AFS037270]